MVALIILVYGLAVIIQLKELRNDKFKKDLWIYGILMFISMALGIALALRLPVPTPTDLINSLVSGFARRFMEVNQTLP